MPQYKLYYFNGRGFAEPVRLCFTAAGVKFEDVRFTGQEWQQKKKEGFSPLGYLPMLEVDGKKLNESLAIMRYVARECGLSPKDSFEVGLCDMVVDALNSVYQKMHMHGFPFEKDEEKKKKLRDEFYANTDHVPNFLTKMTELLKCNKDGKGYIVGSKLSYADISMLTLGDHLSEAEPSILDKYPEVKANYELVRDIATVKEYLKSRPKTYF